MPRWSPSRRLALPGLLLVLACWLGPLRAQAPAAPPDARPKPAEAALELPPFPPEAKVRQTMLLDGRTVAYTCAVQVVPVRDERGKKVAEVVCTAYLAGGEAASRPVTFALNGGPGSSSLWLNLGGIGPKRVPFQPSDTEPSDPVRFQDNPGTWLDFTDLVFIDPVGTGYSRALVEGDEAKRFFTIQGDVDYLARVIHDWLRREGRLASPKYLAGESYGAFRAPRIASVLQGALGVNLSGLILVSSFLDGRMGGAGDVSPLPWIIRLPTLAAARMERQGGLDPSALAPVEAYACDGYAQALLMGWSDPAGMEAMVQKVAQFTGLDPALVRREGGRISDLAMIREPFRNQHGVAATFDLNWTVPDPAPWDPVPRRDVEALDKAVAILSAAMLQFLDQTVGWRPDARYNTLNMEVNMKWEGGSVDWWNLAESFSQLKKVLAQDGRMKVLFCNGYTDLVTPYLGARLLVDQLPPLGDPGRVQVKVYPGGHMFYSRPESLKAFRQDVRRMMVPQGMPANTR